MKKSVTLILVPFKVEKPQSKMIVQVDNEYANGGYLAEVVEVTPQGMFSKITDGKSSWDIMSSRLEAIKIYLISDDEVKVGDICYGMNSYKEYHLWVCTDNKNYDFKMYEHPDSTFNPITIKYLDFKKVIALPEQIGIIAEYQSIAGANSKREINYKDIQGVLDNEGKCSVEWEENQCDGCKARIPILNGNNHKKVGDPTDPFGISCTAHRYDRPKLTAGKVIIHLSE